MGVERCYFPKRHILASLGFLGVFSVYAMRISLSVTIVAMVNSTTKEIFNITNAEEGCPNQKLETEVTEPEKSIGPQYNWDIEKQGLLLGAFYYGYVLTQVPGGFFAERIGAKWIFGLGVLNSAVMSLLTPLVAAWGATAIIILRIIQGLGEGMTFPAINLLICKWSPKIERSRISAFVFTGMMIGCVLSMAIAGWLSGIELLGGWPSVFYFFGSFGCVWFVFWAIFVSETPADHPTIALKEVEYIQQNNDEQPQAKPKTPWKAIFCSMPMWAASVADIGFGFGYFLLATELPTYFSTILHFNIKENGLLSALPFVAEAIFAWIASYFADRLRQSNALSITNIRKIFTTIGLIGPALCLLSITASECRPYLIVFFFTLGMAFNGFLFSGYHVIHIDMCPNFAGTVFAISIAIGNLTGFIAPAVVGALLKRGITRANWNNVFYITAGIYTFAAIFFNTFASAEVQPWATEKEDAQPSGAGTKDTNVAESENK